MKKITAVVAQHLGNATALVAQGKPRDAQVALAKIADTQGDLALRKALSQVSGTDLAAVLVATATQNSAVVGQLVAPADFVRALAELPKSWEYSASPHLTGIFELNAVAAVQELLLGVVMRPKVSDPDAYGHSVVPFMRAIMANDQTAEIVAWWFKATGHADEALNILQTGLLYPPETEGESRPEIGDQVSTGDWSHLLASLYARANGLLADLVRRMQENPTYVSLLPTSSITTPALDASAESSAL